jgi:hypothetical protein
MAQPTFPPSAAVFDTVHLVVLQHKSPIAVFRFHKHRFAGTITQPMCSRLFFTFFRGRFFTNYD